MDKWTKRVEGTERAEDGGRWRQRERVADRAEIETEIAARDEESRARDRESRVQIAGG